MRKGMAAIIGSLLLAGCSVFGVRSGTEQPEYRIVERLSEDVEVRRYGPRVAAETTVEQDDPEAARNDAFRRLFDYISGANRAADEISMTAPVAVAAGARDIAMTAPVETREREGRTTMRFFLPAPYSLETAPAPTDSQVDVVSVPAETLAVLRFSGSRDADAVRARRTDLIEVLEGSAWQVEGAPVALFYDPPWTLPFLRRNEVALPVDRG